MDTVFSIGDKKQWITEWLEMTENTFMRELPKYPEEWNGMELRQRIADIASEEAWEGMMKPKRKKAYDDFIKENGF